LAAWRALRKRFPPGKNSGVLKLAQTDQVAVFARKEDGSGKENGLMAHVILLRTAAC